MCGSKIVEHLWQPNLTYIGFTVAHSAIMIVQNFPNNFNNDRDKLLKIDHRDTLVFLKLASFVNKMTIEISY